MLPQNSTKTSHRAPAAKLVWYQSARSLQNAFVNRPTGALNRRYWLQDTVLSGSQYVMYQAYDSVCNRDCSVRMLSSTVKDKALSEKQLLHEAEVLCCLSHPNIAALYESGRDDQENLFNVMEPLVGRDLHSLLSEVSVLSLERTLEILRAVAAALQHAHDHGFVHTDLDPHCVFLCAESRGAGAASEMVKVLNFGLARPLTADKKETSPNLHLDLIFDAPAYLAPEALELVNKTVDERADQWSLAVLAYQMLSGQLPFRSEDSWCLRALIRGPELPTPLRRLAPQLPPHVSAAIAKALSKDKTQRFASLTDFLRELEGPAAATARPTQPELRVDLIESCRPVSDLHSVPSAKPTEAKTREYPAISFPAELLAAAADPDSVQLPEPHLATPWTGAEIIAQRPSTGPQLWLVLCILMALIPAVTAMHFLHPVARIGALFHHPVAQSVALPPPVVFIALPVASESPTLEAPAVSPANALIHEHKHSHSYHGRVRASRKPASKRFATGTHRSSSSASAVQEALKEGLGL